MHLLSGRRSNNRAGRDRAGPYWGNPQLLDQLRDMLGGIPALHTVKAKPESGSLVLQYDPNKEGEVEDRLRQVLQASLPARRHKASKDEVPDNEFDVMSRKIEAEARFLASRSQSAHAVVEFFKDVDRHVKLATNNAIDLKIVIALGLAAATFVGVGAHAATPMWVTLALFAINHFLEMHPPAAAANPPQGMKLVAA